MKTKSLRLIYFSVLLLIGMLIAFAACGASAGDSGWSGHPSEGDGAEETIVTDAVNRKIVYTVQIGLDADDVAAARDGITAAGKSLGGYVQSQNEYSDGDGYSRASIVFRIPTDRLDEFLSTIESNGDVYSRSVSTTDITTEYVNATAQKAALEERKTALSAILEGDDLTAGDEISVINEISEVNAALQAIELQLTSYDSLIDYSTVTVNVYRNETDIAGIVIGVIVAAAFAGLVAGLCILGKKLHKTTQRLKQAEQGSDPD